MSVEARIKRPVARRRSTADRLRDALLGLAAYQAQVLTHSEKAWASITFAGARHSFALVFTGEDAVAAGEQFVADLPDHEFALPGQLVADAAIVEVEHRVAPNPRMVVQCDLLLLEDA